VGAIVGGIVDVGTMADRPAGIRPTALAAQERERSAKEETLAENERLERLLADKSAPSGPGTR